MYFFASSSWLWLTALHVKAPRSYAYRNKWNMLSSMPPVGTAPERASVFSWELRSPRWVKYSSFVASRLTLWLHSISSP